MNPLTVQSRIRSLETQISVLKAQISSTPPPEIDTLSFGQIYGRFSKIASSSDQEIDEAKYPLREFEASGESAS